jgi:multidrug resistance efflux pump
MKDIIRSTSFALLLILSTLGCQEKETAVEEPVRPVKALKVADADTFQGIKYNGIAQATREVDLSFRVGGPMIARPVNVGDEVKKGKLLARIDPRDYEVRLRNAKAQLARAKASLTAMRQARPEDIRRAQAKVNSSEAKMRLALANYNRVIRIRKADPGAVSQGMIDRALKDRDAAEAELRNSKEELRIAKIGARKEDILAQESEIKALEATVDKTKDDLSDTF